jgi:putative oxidoreductase
MLKNWGRYSEWAPTFLRLAIGVIFIAHGRMKLFGGLDQVEGMLTSMGFPLSGVFAIILACTEFFGGIFLLLGLFTRYAAALIFIVMAVAILKVHLPHGLTGPGGYEFPLSLLVGAIALMLLGSGKASVEKTLLKREF